MKKVSHILAALLLLGSLAPALAFAQSSDTPSPAAADASTPAASQTVTDNADGSVDISQSAGNSSLSASYSFQREGIFGCSYNGAYSMSVGSFAAQGGAYVPVGDATVELNTGVLVYQQCVLREVIDRERESVTSALVKQNVSALLTSRNGAPMFVQQPTNEVINRIADTVLNTLKTWQASSTVPQSVVAGVAAQYKAALDPDSGLGCPAWANDPILKIGVPGCTPFTQYWLAQQRVNTIASAAAYDLTSQLNWGNGFYPQQTRDASGNFITTAPSALVGALANQTVTTGFEQLQNANDVGQMVGALFAGLGTQILSNSNGLTGLAQANAGQPSYLDQLAAESSAGLRDAAVNAAITQLSAAQQVEQQFFACLGNGPCGTSSSGIAGILTQTIAKIRGEESQCWNLIQQKVCVSTATSTQSNAAGTCVDATGNILHIATSTVYSQAVLDAQVAPLATSTAAQLNASQSALTQINQLIQGVTNTSSLDAQRIAIQQLDTMVGKRELHTQTDLTNVQNQEQSVSAAMSTLVQNVAQTWGDGSPDTSNPSDANSGWCSVGNPTTIQMWDQLWQKH